jgi:hypothetical protein
MLVQVAKAEIIASLRSRGLHDRADWIDREFPNTVDTHKNGSLLRMLDIDPDAMSPVDEASMAPTRVDG